MSAPSTRLRCPTDPSLPAVAPRFVLLVAGAVAVVLVAAVAVWSMAAAERADTEGAGGAGLTAERATTRVTVGVILAGSTVAVVALVVGITALRRQAWAHARTHAEAARQAIEVAQRGVALAAANQALARSNRDLDQFAYLASHDLKAPLRGISSLVTWVEEDLAGRADAKVVEHLRLMRGRVERLELLIEGILAYARAGRRAVPAEVVDVGALVRRVAELVPPPAGVELVVAAGE